MNIQYKKKEFIRFNFGTAKLEKKMFDFVLRLGKDLEKSINSVHEEVREG